MLRRITQDAIEVAKVAKQERARLATPADRLEMAPQIHVIRGNDVIALVLLAQHQQGQILQVATAAAIGFDADTLAVIFETYVSGASNDIRKLRHPVTGNRIRSGDITDLAENHDGIAKGWVDEAACIHVVSRAGDSEFVILRYHYETNEDGTRRVEFHGDPAITSTLDGDRAPYGYMYDVLLAAMTSPSMAQAFPREMASATRDERDLFAVRALGRQADVHVVLMAGEDDPERLALLRHFGADVTPTEGEMRDDGSSNTDD